MFPIEIRPLGRAYPLSAGWFGIPVLILLVRVLLGIKTSFGVLYMCSGSALFLLGYIKNKTLRLDENGITQGFSVFSTFMTYDSIMRVKKATRVAKGVSTVVLVVSGNSRKRIEIPTFSFERSQLNRVVDMLAERAPQIGPKADLRVRDGEEFGNLAFW